MEVRPRNCSVGGTDGGGGGGGDDDEEGPVDGGGGRATGVVRALVRRTPMGLLSPGLGRSGKSCRLRWVNYLHPGLKHGRFAPEEEQLVIQLHAKWGNRWSLIARSLPGRTDNEIKNYWRTHMRKKAQKSNLFSSPSSSSSSSSSPANVLKNELESMAEEDTSAAAAFGVSGGVKVYSMDQIWDEIAASESFCEVEDDELEMNVKMDDDNFMHNF